MDKVLVEIECPATGKHYDFWLPKQITVREAVEKITEEIMAYEANDQLFSPEHKPMLYHCMKEVIADENQTVTEAGITGGSRIMVV